MIPAFDPVLWRRASWTVLLLALVAFVSLGLAEQGARGGGLQAPPDAPLPFERHRVFGINLSAMSSLQALDWLNAAGNPTLAFVIVPVDAEVVALLSVEETRDTALLAIDTLRQAAGNSPIAVCLRRPADVPSDLETAQAAVSTINARFPAQIVYVFACQPDDNPEWQADIAEAARPDAETAPPGNAMISLAGGAPILLDRIDSASQLTSEQFRLRSRGSYSMYLLDAAEPLNPATVEDAATALAGTSHSTLVLITPTDAVDPAELTASIGSVILAGSTLPEGFSSVNAPAIALNAGWQRTSVGTVGYVRATGSTAALSASFVGTDIYLAGIESPDSGLVQIWIDPESPTAPPTLVLDLAAAQARDAAIPIATGLPAARHELILRAVNDDGQSITLSGLFVTGTPATAWTGTMAAVVVFAAAVVALSERCYAAITAIRRRSGPPRRRARTGHPRVFARDR